MRHESKGEAHEKGINNKKAERETDAFTVIKRENSQ